MLIPTRVSVDVSLSDEVVDFRCSRCDHRAQVAVAGAGTGLRVHGLAVSDGAMDARLGAAATARLAACPRCGHRDGAAVARVLLLGALVGVLAGFAAGLATLEQYGLAMSAAVAVGAGTFLLGVVAAAAIKLAAVKRKVRFLAPR